MTLCPIQIYIVLIKVDLKRPEKCLLFAFLVMTSRRQPLPQ